MAFILICLLSMGDVKDRVFLSIRAIQGKPYPENTLMQKSYNDKNDKLSVSFLQLFEHIGEALPQFILALVYYINNYNYIASKDFSFEVFGFLITQTLISMILSAISILKGIVTGIISCYKLKAWKASENEQNETP